MLRRTNWLARVLGYAWIGVLTFVLIRPATGLATGVQITGYSVLGVGLLAWAFAESASRQRRDVRLAPVMAVIAAAGGLGAGAGNGGFAMVAFVFVAAMVAGGGSELHPALAVTAAGVSGIELAAAITGGGYAVFALMPIFAVAGLIVGRNWRFYRVQAEQSVALLARSEQLQREQRRADLLDERARLAREIHDVLAHSLGALGIQVQAARAVLADHGDVLRADALLARAQQMTADGLVETRHAIHALRADPPPLIDELAHAGDTHAQRYRVLVEVDVVGEPVMLAPEVTLGLVRVTQESLVNAAKHAAHESVAIRVSFCAGHVELRICNRLPDESAKPRSTISTVDGGWGLTGMGERIRLLGGTLDAGNRDNHWVVSANVPHASAVSHRD